MDCAPVSPRPSRTSLPGAACPCVGVSRHTLCDDSQTSTLVDITLGQPVTRAEGPVVFHEGVAPSTLACCSLSMRLDSPSRERVVCPLCALSVRTCVWYFKRPVCAQTLFCAARVRVRVCFKAGRSEPHWAGPYLLSCGLDSYCNGCVCVLVAVWLVGKISTMKGCFTLVCGLALCEN